MELKVLTEKGKATNRRLLLMARKNAVWATGLRGMERTGDYY